MGWALAAEQFPYAAGAARSIMLDRHLGLAPEDDDRLAIVFCGEGGSQNGRLAEVMNCAAKEKLPLLILCIDNGRAINTFTPDVAQNSEVWKAGAKVDGTNLQDVLRTGRAVVDYVRETSSPAILQVHTYRLQGHSPADPEHERGRKAEKKWARAEADPLKIFEATGALPQDVLDDRKKKASVVVKEAVAFAKESPPPPRELAKELEFPDPADTDYNTREVANDSEAITQRSVDAAKLAECQERIAMLQQQAKDPGLNVGDALNLAILEEMVRDPRTTIHAEDLQAGSSYDIPRQTQQTFGELRAADEIILDESTQSGGVGASISALVGEELFDELDAPVKRLCMDDAPVPYASSMEQAVVKRGSDLVIAVKELVDYV